MQHTNDLFDLDNLDLLTKEEKEFNSLHIKKLKGYAEGKVQGVEIRNLTSGAATIAKRQQSRSAIEKAFKIFYGDNYFVNIGQHNENENIASLKNEIISLRGKLEQCEKNFTDVRREYLERIETILSKCSEGASFS